MKNKYNLLILFLLCIIVVYSFSAAKGGGDFDVYLGAAVKLKQALNIYQPPFFKGLQYFYSPLFALILVPFSFLPFWITEFFWECLSFFLLYRIWLLLNEYFKNIALSKKNKRVLVMLSLLLSVRFILYNISMVQVTIFLLWGTLESLKLFNNKKVILGALLLALVINIKILPIIFIPYLFYTKKIKAGILVLFFSILLLALPAIFISVSYNNFLLVEWWKVINPSNAVHMLEAENGPHSLVAAIPVFITNTVGTLPIKRNFINLPLSTTMIVTNVVRLLFVAIVFLFFKRMPFKKPSSILNEYLEISYLLIVTPLLFPHQQKYAFIYIFPMVLYLLYYFLSVPINNNIEKAKLTCFVILGFLFTPIIGRDIIGNYLYDVLQHYRVLTFATILLIPITLLSNPKNISTSRNSS